MILVAIIAFIYYKRKASPKSTTAKAQEAKVGLVTAKETALKDPKTEELSATDKRKVAIGN